MSDTSLTDLGAAFNEKAIEAANAEVSRGFIETTIQNFRDQKEFAVKIKFPTVETDSESSKVYGRTMTELLMGTGNQSMVTKAEMENTMRERGIWGPKQDQEIEDIEDRIVNLMREGQTMHSQKKVNKKRLKEITDEYLSLKRQKNNLISTRESFLSNTVEGMADIAALEYKIYMCSEDKDGNRLWENFDAFKQEFNRIAVVTLLQKAMVFWSGLPQGALDVLPEDLFFRERPSEQSQEVPSGA